jgi:Flp pilus assembly protein TadB
MKNYRKNKNILTRKQRELQASAIRRDKQQADEKDAKHTWYLELAIAACCGAALALGFVAIHMMLTTEWTW